MTSLAKSLRHNPLIARLASGRSESTSMEQSGHPQTPTPGVSKLVSQPLQTGRLLNGLGAFDIFAVLVADRRLRRTGDRLGGPF